VDKCWVVNASPLIFLGRLDKFEFLLALADEVIVPDAVFKEVSARDSGKALTIAAYQSNSYPPGA
jgi:predicted nucleic acid-binding protein